MATTVNNLGTRNFVTETSWAQIAVPAARFFYSLIFILSGFGHFKQQTIEYAMAQGVPIPQVLVPLSGLMILFGGLSILLGYRARVGALLIILFLIPVTLMMHNFWDVADPMMRQIQQGMFMKNLSMLGAAIMIYFYGSGPVSLDNRNRV